MMNSVLMHRCLLILLAVWSAFSSPALAANKRTDASVFESVRQAFQTKDYENAERWCGEFTRDFPKSPNRAQAVLWQAQSRYYLTNYEGAVVLLRAELAQADALADQYRFWIAEILFQTGDFRAAADAYAEFIRRHPESPQVLDAGFNEALSRFRAGNGPEAIKLLSDPAGAYARAARTQPEALSALRGHLLLA